MHRAPDLGPTLRGVVALFLDENSLNAAANELQVVGFDRAEVAVLPRWKVVERKIGRKLKSVPGLEDEPHASSAMCMVIGSPRDEVAIQASCKLPRRIFGNNFTSDPRSNKFRPARCAFKCRN